MKKLRDFTNVDWYGWQGCERFADDSSPCISEGNKGTLVVSGSYEKDGRAIISVYFGEDGSDWGFKFYVNKECAIREAEFLVDLLDTDFTKEKWQEFGFQMVC